MLIAVTFLLALATTLAATPLVTRVAVYLRWYDVPESARRVHTKPVPRLGGVAVFAGFSVAIAVAYAVQGMAAFSFGRANLLGILCAGGAIAFLTGLVDDVNDTRPATKLFGQMLAAVTAFAFGCRIETVGFGDSVVALGAFSMPVTVIWIVAVTNAFNLIDGLDGLATGIALVALTTILAAAAMLGNLVVLLPGVALIGALIGFLRYNFNPARIFLGDSGSLFIGYSLGVLGVVGSLKSATAILAVVPLCAVGLPLMDTSLAVFRRWLRGLPLSEPDTRHLHHRLVALGLTHRRAVAIMYAASAFIGMIGLSLAFASPRVVWVISILGGVICLLLFVYGLRFLNYHEFAETLGVLAHAPRRLRRAIRDQIEAQDVAAEIRRCTSVNDMNTALSEAAKKFDFLAMEVCEETQPIRLPRLSLEAVVTRPWRLDFPVIQYSIAGDWLVRIWCSAGVSRPYGAERVARVLAPAIAERFENAKTVATPPEVVAVPARRSSGAHARHD